MLKLLKKSGRLELALLLSAMTLCCFAMSVFRVYLSGTGYYLFLNWNLFLASLPWVASSLLIHKPSLKQGRLALAGLLAFWVLFFPNSPYILTDLFHLRARSGVPVWYDLVLILAFAWTGLAFGFTSLLDIERLLLERIRRPAVTALIVFLLFLSGFGIYLGRFLRWNSWDVLHAPLSLLADVADRFADPLSHSRTWGVTLAMGILLNMMYWSIKAMRHHSGHGAPGAHVSHVAAEAQGAA